MLPPKSLIGLTLAAYVSLTTVPVSSKQSQDVRVKIDRTAEIIVPHKDSSKEFEFYVCDTDRYYPISCKTDLVGNFSGKTNVPEGTCIYRDRNFGMARFVPEYSDAFSSEICKESFKDLLKYHQNK